MLWDKCLNRLQAEIDANDIALFLKPLRFTETDEGLELFAPNEIVAHRVRDNFLPLIRAACEEIRQQPCQINLHLSAESSLPKRKRRSALPERPQARLESNIDPRFTFDNFVEGQSNTIAKHSALQIAEEPHMPLATAYCNCNPGPSFITRIPNSSSTPPFAPSRTRKWTSSRNSFAPWMPC